MDCRFDGCGRKSRSKGYCVGHYYQQYRGEKLRPLRGDSSPVKPMEEIEDVWAVELLATGGEKIGEALVSSEDVGRVREHRWGLGGNGYVRKSNGSREYLHRFIMQPERKQEVDHRNGIPKDCRRENLRVVTTAQNKQNQPPQVRSSTGHRNVYFNKEKQKYRVALTVDGKHIFGGYFSDLDAAVEAAKELRNKHFTHHVESRCSRP